MKSLNQIRDMLMSKDFDLNHETKMVQARLLSPILKFIGQEKITQVELEEKTGLKQSFLSALFNNKRRLNMEHIAKLQHALGIKLQEPDYLTDTDHYDKFYNPENDIIYSVKALSAESCIMREYSLGSTIEQEQKAAYLLDEHTEVKWESYSPVIRAYTVPGTVKKCKSMLHYKNTNRGISQSEKRLVRILRDNNIY